MNVDSIEWPFLLSFLAGISTLIGSLIFLFIKEFKKSNLSFFLGLSAGVMIYVSFMELLPLSIKSLGFLRSNIAFFVGIFMMGLLDFLIPHNYIEEYVKEKQIDTKLLTTGLMIFVGILLHNFPEGMAVFMSSLMSIKSGVLLTIATALHNIPEGISVAVPIYFATKSRKQAFKFSFFSGMAEPLGAIICYLILRPFLTPTLLSYIFAIIAGIMLFISFDELLPTCFKQGQGHIALGGIFLGMLVMALSLILLT